MIWGVNMKRLMLLVAIGLVFAMPALLQAERNCDTASLQTAIQTQLNEIDDNPIAVLIKIIHLVERGLFDCADDTWSMSGHQGAQPVIGPLPLHEGFYIFKLTTDGSAKVEATALDGCGKDLSGALFSISAGQAIYSAENLVQAEDDCIIYLEMSKISASWTLEIAKVR